MANEIQQLRLGLQSLGLGYSDTQLLQLEAYLDLLERWNRAYNLTALKNRQEWVSKHILDSLAIFPWIDRPRIIDVGTGAGFPGIPLAIFRPDSHIALLDSNGKKTRFLFQVKTQLQLENVDIIESRVETYQPRDRYDQVVSRAFASLSEMVCKCGHILSTNGSYMAMKSALVETEIAQMEQQMPNKYSVMNIHDLTVPGIEGARVLVELQPKQAVIV